MYTSSHFELAERLRKSCEQFNLPHVLYEVPTIHNSISVRGTSDLEFTKPNFIQHLLNRHNRPILYLDVDCVFRAYPTLIDELLDDGTTFAVYNWLADVDNDAFYPINVRLNGQVIQDRFFAYSHRLGFYSTEQLICSGCVQLFDSSPAAAALLAMWHNVIEKYPGAADDECLSFAFNNGGAKLNNIRWSWLTKEYARYAWWIFVKPVIEHPELPGLNNAGFTQIPRGTLVRQFYAELCEPTDARFPEDSVIDVKDRLLYELIDGRLALLGPLDLELWTPTVNRAPETIDIVEIQGKPN